MNKYINVSALNLDKCKSIFTSSTQIDNSFIYKYIYIFIYFVILAYIRQVKFSFKMVNFEWLIFDLKKFCEKSFLKAMSFMHSQVLRYK